MRKDLHVIDQPKAPSTKEGIFPSGRHVQIQSEKPWMLYGSEKIVRS